MEKLNDVMELREFLKSNTWKEWAEKEHPTDQRRGVPYPPPQKPAPASARRIDLVEFDQMSVGEMPLKYVMAKRRSRRRYTPDCLTLEELSWMLWATQGLYHAIDFAGGTLTRRTVPAAGSMHTFETYLWINRVAGLTPGIYRYLTLEHKLILVRAGSDLADDVVEACCGQKFVSRAAVVFFWAAVPYRQEWRYTILAAKEILKDAGHVCQNLYLASEAVGAGTCALGAYDQETADALLGIDGQDELVVYAASVGKVKPEESARV